MNTKIQGLQELQKEKMLQSAGRITCIQSTACPAKASSCHAPGACALRTLDCQIQVVTPPVELLDHLTTIADPRAHECPANSDLTYKQRHRPRKHHLHSQSDTMAAVLSTKVASGAVAGVSRPRVTRVRPAGPDAQCSFLGF